MSGALNLHSYVVVDKYRYRKLKESSNSFGSALMKTQDRSVEMSSITNNSIHDIIIQFSKFLVHDNDFPAF